MSEIPYFTCTVQALVKCVHKGLSNRLKNGLPRKCVSRLTDRPGMTPNSVDWTVNPQMKQAQILKEMTKGQNASLEDPGILGR